MIPLKSIRRHTFLAIVGIALLLAILQHVP
jgi:hypothetical protein